MRKILLIILFFICEFNSNAQTNVYHPFPYSNAIWRVNGSYWDCNPLCDFYQYTTGTDTLISTHTYSKIYQSGIYNFSSWDSLYRGCLRNDTLNKKVYFVDVDSINERLLYDFSLTTGDTIFGIMPGLSAGYGVISSVDSILVGSNYHKIFIVGGLSIIEGVGSSEGLLELFFYQFESAYQLICFSNNSDVYPNSNTSCPLIRKLELNIPRFTNQQLSIDIYPNPFNSSTTIDFSDEQRNTSIKITDILGQEIKTINLTGRQLILEKEEMKEGIYFIKINGGTEIKNKKIIVQ
ncbi:MAG: T9SS type A sorting domain-containing protein [Bacteroidota bacterium]